MTWSMVTRPAAAIVMIAALAGAARADEFIDRANGLYSAIRPNRRSDVSLLAAMAKMTPPPAAIEARGRAMFLPAGSKSWNAVLEWAQAAPQRAVLDALDKVTKDDNPQDTMAFAQPYGAAALGSGPEAEALVKAGLFTDLGEHDLLAAAKFRYLERMEHVVSLANVEATRLAAEGKPGEAVNVLIDLLHLGKQIAEREFYVETDWGLATLYFTLERIRDVVYQDFRSEQRKLKADDLVKIIDRLRTDRGASLRADRIVFPRADRIAAEQVIARVFGPDGRPRPDFGQVMARLASTRRPLRLFAEAARWTMMAAGHQDRGATRRQLALVYDDLATRWPLEAFDSRQTSESDLEKMDRAEFAVISAILPDDILKLFHKRQLVRTQIVGTRCALGVCAFYDTARNFPPVLTAISPRYVATLDPDPFNSDRAGGKRPLPQFFVPIRDQAAGSGGPRPHAMNVSGPWGEFQTEVGQDQFVLYSVGPDDSRDWARDVNGGDEKDIEGDMLLWPPLLSLFRQHLAGQGLLDGAGR